jgi:hypothetical protein
MQITVKNQTITLTAGEAHALRRALGYHLHKLVQSLRDRPRTVVTGRLAVFTRDDWDHAQAEVVPGPGMARFAVRVAGLAVELGQAEALRVWKQLEAQLADDE